MSRKTEPRMIDKKRGNCSNCGGIAYEGMYHEKCNYCDTKGKALLTPKE